MSADGRRARGVAWKPSTILLSPQSASHISAMSWRLLSCAAVASTWIGVRVGPWMTLPTCSWSSACWCACRSRAGSAVAASPGSSLSQSGCCSLSSSWTPGPVRRLPRVSDGGGTGDRVPRDRSGQGRSWRIRDADPPRRDRSGGERRAVARVARSPAWAGDSRVYPCSPGREWVSRPTPNHLGLTSLFGLVLALSLRPGSSRPRSSGWRYRCARRGTGGVRLALRRCSALWCSALSRCSGTRRIEPARVAIGAQSSPPHCSSVPPCCRSCQRRIACSVARAGTVVNTSESNAESARVPC